MWCMISYQTEHKQVLLLLLKRDYVYSWVKYLNHYCFVFFWTCWLDWMYFPRKAVVHHTFEAIWYLWSIYLGLYITYVHTSNNYSPFVIGCRLNLNPAPTIITKHFQIIFARWTFHKRNHITNIDQIWYVSNLYYDQNHEEKKITVHCLSKDCRITCIGLPFLNKINVCVGLSINWQKINTLSDFVRHAPMKTKFIFAPQHLTLLKISKLFVLCIRFVLSALLKLNATPYKYKCFQSANWGRKGLSFLYTGRKWNVSHSVWIMYK